MSVQERLICASADLLDGGDGVRFETLFGGQKTPAFVVRHHGKVYGYLNRCGHVPVEIDWQPGRFFEHSDIYLICATHGALYAPETGRCLGGRCAGKGLKPVAISEHDNGVYITETE